jgi:AraC-like DNA-binding protein
MSVNAWRASVMPAPDEDTAMQEANGVFGLHQVEFPADKIPRGQHLEFWRRACAREARIMPLASDWHFITTPSYWSVGDLAVFLHGTTPTRFERGRDLIESGNRRWLVVRLLLRGSHALAIDERIHLKVTPELLVVQDFSVPYVGVTSDYEMLSLRIPRELVAGAERLGPSQPAIVWDRKSPQGSLLRGAIDIIFARLGTIDTDGAASVSAGFAGLLGGLLSAEPGLQQNRATEKSRLDAMKRYINQHLRDPGLSAKVLGERFYCSRATVYRLFEGEGGVASYIQRQRLNGCMRELVRMQQPPKGVLEQIAAAWGFGNPQRFSRLFRAEFSITPQEALKAQAPLPSKDLDLTGRDDYWRSAAALSQWLNGVRRC